MILSGALATSKFVTLELVLASLSCTSCDAEFDVFSLVGGFDSSGLMFLESVVDVESVSSLATLFCSSLSSVVGFDPFFPESLFNPLAVS